MCPYASFFYFKHKHMKRIKNSLGLFSEPQDEVKLPNFVRNEMKCLVDLALDRKEFTNILKDIGYFYGDKNSPEVFYEDKSFSGAYGDVKFIKSFINGKWNFMMRIWQIKESCPNSFIRIGLKGLNTKQIDSALPEIQQRLRCQVRKAWKQGRRCGWNVYLNISYQEKGDDYDYFQV